VDVTAPGKNLVSNLCSVSKFRTHWHIQRNLQLCVVVDSLDLENGYGHPYPRHSLIATPRQREPQRDVRCKQSCKMVSGICECVYAIWMIDYNAVTGSLRYALTACKCAGLIIRCLCNLKCICAVCNQKNPPIFWFCIFFDRKFSSEVL